MIYKGVCRLKKMLLTLLVLLLITALLVSCGGSGVDEPIRIAIITSSGSVDDESFNQNNFEGITRFIENHGNATVQVLREATGRPDEAIQYVSRIVSSFDILVLPGFQFEGISELAMAHPETYFIVVDTRLGEINGVNEFPNVMSILFAEQESGFLAGVAAALESRTGHVAFVGGIAVPPVINFHMGFEAGVNYSNRNLGTNVRLVSLPQSAATFNDRYIGGNYVDAFGDPATGRMIANALIDEGVDIIFAAAGLSGQGVFEAVKLTDYVMVIGVDVDQFGDGYTSHRNIVLTSALKAMDINVERGLNYFASGTFEGGNLTMRADSLSTGIVTEPNRHQMSDDTLGIIDRLFSRLVDGSLVPPDTFNYTPTNFPGLEGR